MPADIMLTALQACLSTDIAFVYIHAWHGDVVKWRLGFAKNNKIDKKLNKRLRILLFVINEIISKHNCSE